MCLADIAAEKMCLSAVQLRHEGTDTTCGCSDMMSVPFCVALLVNGWPYSTDRGFAPI